MIPIKLELEAFLAFREKLTLDFRAVQEDKMFLITGSTGSGKTSLFDAVCYALYGEASGSQRSPDSFKSQFADDSTECWVALTFENKGKSYTIRRAPAQQKLRRGGNLSVQPASAVLTLDNGASLTRISEVNQRIEQLLGLTAEQFKKIVMLPQGEFRRFLGDSSAGKQEILRRIFGTGIFDRFTEELKEQYQEISSRIQHVLVEQSSLSSQLDPLSDPALETLLQSDPRDYPAILALAGQLTDGAAASAQVQRAEMERLSGQITALNLPAAKELNRKLDLFKATGEQYAQLLEQSEEQAEKRRLISHLEQVREVQGVYRNLLSAQEKEQGAQQKLLDYTRRLKDAQTQFSQVSQSYEAQQKINSTLPQTAREITQKQAVLAVFDQLDKLKQEQTELEQALAQHKQYSRRLELTEELNRLEQAAGQLAALQAGERRAEVLSRQAGDALARWQEGCEVFFASQSSLLAKELKPGKPCPVCGSVHHPSPAQPSGGQELTKSELDGLSQQYEAARSLFDREGTKLAALRAACALLPAADAEQLEREIQELQGQLDSLPQQPGLNGLTREENTLALNRADAELHHNCQSQKELAGQLSAGSSREQLAGDILSLTAYLEENTRRLEAVTEERNAARTQLDKLTEAKEQAQALTAQYGEERRQLDGEYSALLEENGLGEPEFLQLASQLPRLEQLREQVGAYERDTAAKQQLLEAYSAELAGRNYADLPAMEQQAATLRQELNEVTARYESLIKSVSANQKLLQRLQKLEKSFAGLSAEYGEAGLLYNTASGKNRDRVSFERYVLSVYFDQVIDSANLRLTGMTDSRYFLRRRESREKGNQSSGLDLEIFDAHSGKYRHVNTLSGGESFKTALCLALGLADVITRKSGGVEINTIFIDEGFGTLDQQALDSAIDCLCRLKDSGRYIGIISHVAELREKIPARLLVSQGKDGSTARFL